MSSLSATPNSPAPAVVKPGGASNAGMTTRVVRGGLWSLGGQVVTLGLSLLATPFVIRFLGDEVYGVLALINVMLSTMGFADFGMANASTKFGSEAFSRNDQRGEAAAVWTSLLIAMVPTVLLCLSMMLLAPVIVVQWLRLPVHLHDLTIVAVRIAAICFAARTAANIWNTPQLARLRFDLNTLIQTGCNGLQIVLVPIVLWRGGSLITAVMVMAAASLLASLLHWLVSGSLLPAMRRPRFDRALCGSLLRYGGPAVLGVIASLVLYNSEKFLLTRTAGTSALAHYAMAFTLANLLTVAPTALSQALMPAFSRLNALEDSAPLQQLVRRAMRGVLFGGAPVAVLMCVFARPFLTRWAGPEFGVQSTLPFYILVGGLSFNTMAYVPYILLLARGRTDFIAKFQWAEVLPYLSYTWLFTHLWGAPGAALAWTTRVVLATVISFAMAPKLTGVSFSPAIRKPVMYVVAMSILGLALLLVITQMVPWLWQFAAVVTALVAYAFLLARHELSNDERDRLRVIVANRFRFARRGA